MVKKIKKKERKLQCGEGIRYESYQSLVSCRKRVYGSAKEVIQGEKKRCRGTFAGRRDSLSG